MVCYDIFCFVCGNPNRNVWNYEYEEQLEALNLSKGKETKIIENLKQLIKSSIWMSNCTLLLENNITIHELKEYACNTQFRDKNGPSYDVLQSGHDKKKTPNGIFLHTDCWNFVKQKYKISLKCSDLYPYINYPKTSFGEIQKYWGQDFDFIQIAIDNKNYLCSSPFKNDKNITQIKKNISKLKLKYDTKRKSPMCSATFYKQGDIKLGQNNKLWILKNHKWMEINEPLISKKISLDVKKINNKQNKFIMVDTPYIGLHNNKPIFLKSINWKDNICDIEFLLIESYSKTFDKLFTIT
jgi:hypothetical protein